MFTRTTDPELAELVPVIFPCLLYLALEASLLVVGHLRKRRRGDVEDSIVLYNINKDSNDVGSEPLRGFKPEPERARGSRHK